MRWEFLFSLCTDDERLSIDETDILIPKSSWDENRWLSIVHLSLVLRFNTLVSAPMYFQCMMKLDPRELRIKFCQIEYDSRCYKIMATKRAAVVMKIEIVWFPLFLESLAYQFKIKLRFRIFFFFFLTYIYKIGSYKFNVFLSDVYNMRSASPHGLNRKNDSMDAYLLCVKLPHIFSSL